MESMAIVEELIDLVGEVASIADYRDAYKRQLRSLSRRIQLLAPLFEELKESRDSISDQAIGTLVQLRNSLDSAKELLKFGSEGSKIFLALEWDKVMKRFQEVTAQMEQALAGISLCNFGISNEVITLVELVHTQLKRGKDRVDTPDVELFDDILSVDNESDTFDPEILERLAEKLQLTTILDLTRESVALHEIVVATDSTASKAMFMLLEKIKNFMQTQNPEPGNPPTDKVSFSDDDMKVSVASTDFLSCVSEMKEEALIAGTEEEFAIIGYGHVKARFCHHDHKLELKDEATPYVCSGCREMGFYGRYICGVPFSFCDLQLHRACAFPEPTITPSLFPHHSFVFLSSGEPDQCCGACGRGIKGFVYHCYDDGLDLHPSCATLPYKIDGDWKLGLHHQVSSKCDKCGKRLRNKKRRRPYETVYECRLCADCVQDMLLDNWKQEYPGGRDNEDKTLFMGLNEYNKLKRTEFPSGRDGEKDGVGENKERALAKRKMRKLQLVLDKGKRRSGMLVKHMKIAKLAITYVIAVVVGDPTALVASVISSLAD